MIFKSLITKTLIKTLEAVTDIDNKNQFGSETPLVTKKMNCCVNLIRFLLFLLNSVFFLGFSALAGGATYLLLNVDKIFTAPVDYDGGGGRSYLLALIVLLVVFAFLALLTCLGCSGPAAKSSCLMKTFTAFLILLICATVGVLLLLNIESGRKATEDSAQLVVREGLHDSLAAYQEDEKGWSSWLWQKIQSNYTCCGLPHYIDIEQSPVCCLSQNKTDCQLVEKCSDRIFNSTLIARSGESSVNILSCSLPFMVISLLASLLFTRALSSHRRSRLESENADEDFQQMRYGDNNPAFNPQYHQDTEMSTFPNAPPSYDEVVSSRN